MVNKFASEQGCDAAAYCATWLSYHASLRFIDGGSTSRKRARLARASPILNHQRSGESGRRPPAPDAMPRCWRRPHTLVKTTKAVSMAKPRQFRGACQGHGTKSARGPGASGHTTAYLMTPTYAQRCEPLRPDGRAHAVLTDGMTTRLGTLLHGSILGRP